ncbi:MAG: 2TM domain-containing protein [Deltaproteobacteria bacterium]|nr:2TM domain-containing protein [Deltaproteobacteria bacterium]
MSDITLQSYQKAHRAVQVKDSKKGFKIHLLVYVLNNIVLVTVNLMTNPEYLWCLGSLFGWGVGVISHYITAVAIINKKLAGMEAEAEALAADGVS